MGQLDAFNLLHDLVSRGVDDINGGPGATRVVDKNPPRRQGQRYQQHPKQKSTAT